MVTLLFILVYQLYNYEPKLEELFDKSLAGTTIEKLDDYGEWLPKEKIRYKHRERFIISETYATLIPFETIRLTLTRDLELDWSVGFG